MEIEVIERVFLASTGIDRENFDEYEFKYLNPLTGSLESSIVYVFEGMQPEDKFFVEQIKKRVEEDYKRIFKSKYNSLKILSELNNLEFYEVVQIQSLINEENKTFILARIANALESNKSKFLGGDST